MTIIQFKDLERFNDSKLHKKYTILDIIKCLEAEMERQIKTDEGLKDFKISLFEDWEKLDYHLTIKICTIDNQEDFRKIIIPLDLIKPRKNISAFEDFYLIRAAYRGHDQGKA